VGSSSAYQSAAWWKEFYNVVEDPSLYSAHVDQPIESPPVIEAEHIEVWSYGGKLYVNSPFDEQITLYSYTGKAVYTARKPAGRATFAPAIPRGIYILRSANGWTRKVAFN
jgi:hypothetical protein